MVTDVVHHIMVVVKSECTWCTDEKTCISFPFWTILHFRSFEEVLFDQVIKYALAIFMTTCLESFYAVNQSQ